MKGIVINLKRREDRLELFMQQEFPFPIERFNALTALKGEDGCTYSHLAVLTMQTEFPFIVFEDDCLMLEPWEKVEEAMRQLPPQWDALFLGANLTKKLTRYSSNLFLLSHAYCLHAVIYNSSTMVDFILENHKTPANKNLDIFYYNEVFRRFKCFITYPMIATQRASVSDICGTSVNYGMTELLENYKINTIGDGIQRPIIRSTHKTVIRSRRRRIR